MRGVRQIVRHVVDGIPHPADQCIDACEHLVEHAHEGIEFIAGATPRDASIETARFNDLLRGTCEILHGPERPRGEEGAAGETRWHENQHHPPSHLAVVGEHVAEIFIGFPDL